VNNEVKNEFGKVKPSTVSVFLVPGNILKSFVQAVRRDLHEVFKINAKCVEFMCVSPYLISTFKTVKLIWMKFSIKGLHQKLSDEFKFLVV
jgi:hypothetical protein